MSPSNQGPRCSVWRASIEEPYVVNDAFLDDVERDRADSFRQVADRNRFLLGRSTARRAVADVLGLDASGIRFDLHCPRCGGAHGKPTVHGFSDVIDVSIAHSGDHVLVAVATGASVGVDIEEVRPDLDMALLAPESLTDVEIAQLTATPADDLDRAFLRIWTRKEALVKATGAGMFTALRGIEVSAPWDTPRLVSWVEGPRHDEVRLWDLDAPSGYIASAAALTGGPIELFERR